MDSGCGDCRRPLVGDKIWHRTAKIIQELRDCRSKVDNITLDLDISLPVKAFTSSAIIVVSLI